MSIRIHVIRFLPILLLLPTTTLADDPETDLQRSLGPAAIHGGPADPTVKAARDTFLLMGSTGSGAPYVGDFESPVKALDPGDPANHGWTSVDLTQPTESHWHVSDYFAVNGTYSAFCGDETIPSCDEGVTDPVGGYDDNWNDLLEFRGTVADNLVSTTLTVTATANVYSEPGYDFTTLRAEKFDMGFVDIANWDGVSFALLINETVTYLPEEYMGVGHDEVVIIWHFGSDGGWSDTDCRFFGSGAIQLDDVTITSDNGVGTGGTVDFEDGTMGPLAVRLAQGVGDFASIRSNLHDADGCASNFSRQVTFIDDGLVVPGTGGSPCQDWCYGPNGFIVNTAGGLAGPEYHIHNYVLSPVMDWPDPIHRGARFTFNVYRHEDLSADAPGIFYEWGVRSSNTGDPADIETADWLDQGFVYYGGPDYRRDGFVLNDLLVTNPTHVQVGMGVYEFGWVWGWIGNDGYPAPYFDNARFETFPVIGPNLVAVENRMAHDAFPASGTIDMTDPAGLSVRFDVAPYYSTEGQRVIRDSLTFDVVVTRPGATMVGLPQLHYMVKRNPVFDPYRTSLLPAEGQVDCGIVTNSAGIVVEDRYFGDLDDEGFLFPGDIVHYFLTAADDDGSVVETSIMPADTTGYSDFMDPMAYTPWATVHCLPTISDLSGTQPPALFWNGQGNRGGRDEWYSAFAHLGLVPGRDFDVFFKNAPSGGGSTGITMLQVAGYETIAFTRGALTGGNFSEHDAETMMLWLDQGDKGLFAVGDGLASSLVESGLITGQLLSDYFRVTFNDPDIRNLIDGQISPRIQPAASQTTFNTVGSWVAYGNCPFLNSFDAVTVTGGAVRLAVWTDPTGADGSYPYSAATLAYGVGLAGTSEVISLPYAFKYIYTDPQEDLPAKADARLAGRTRLLNDVLLRFGVAGNPADVSGTDAPGAVAFGASHHPNPFNPQVNLNFTIARPGRLTVKVYDLRGRLVRSLFDERVTAATTLAWDGLDDRGADTASGVYFYEARMHNEVKVGKLTLVR